MPRPLENLDIGCLVSREQLFDFAILHESLEESWTSYPFTLHAFAGDDQVAQRLADAAFTYVEVHRTGATHPLELIEHSGLERCIVTDAGNVFLTETPELSLLLGECDLVFVGGPTPDRPIQSSLWSFRRTPHSIRFADRWRARWTERNASHAGRVLVELVESEDDDGADIRVVTPVAQARDGYRPSPYGLDADLPQLSLRRDLLGFREVRAGLVKVLHFSDMEGTANRSLADRIEFVANHYPQAAPALTLYARLARRAAVRLDLEAVPRIDQYMRERLLEAGVPLTRNHLPALLNRRGLRGTGAEVGVKVGNFSEAILQAWEGQRLISVDAWGNGVPDDAGDETTKEEHERFYRETLERLGKFGDRSSVWRMTSVEAASRIEQGSLDFVYIDARHDYDSVTEDLEQWFGKIRSGGVFAGHDYMDSDSPSYQVKRAVDEFFAARGLPVKATYGEGRTATWVVEIPAS